MTPAPTGRPAWQHDPCPAWCVAEHREHDPPEDRVHDSAARYVPVVLREAGVATPTELLVVLSRHCDEPDAWVLVGQPERDGQHLLLRRDAALDVARALGTVAESRD